MEISFYSKLKCLFNFEAISYDIQVGLHKHDRVRVYCSTKGTYQK